jgi:ethanolamine utilization microcompartment shell protein EutL
MWLNVSCFVLTQSCEPFVSCVVAYGRKTYLHTRSAERLVRSLQNEAVRIMFGPDVSEVRRGLGWWLGEEDGWKKVLQF